MDRYLFGTCHEIVEIFLESKCKGSNYKNVYISVTIDSRGLGVVPMDRYLFGTCHDIVEKM